VTHVRVSIDAEPVHFPTRWRSGLTALLHAAAGVRPFVDVVLTSSPQPGLPYAWDPSGAASYPELAVLLAALSTGPVAVGDGLGSPTPPWWRPRAPPTAGCCGPPGPAVVLDDQLAAEAHGPGAPPGTAFQAHSFIPAGPGGGRGGGATAVWDYATVLVVDAATPRIVAPISLSPPLPTGGRGPAAAPRPGAHPGKVPRAAGVTAPALWHIYCRPVVARVWGPGGRLRARRARAGLPAPRGRRRAAGAGARRRQPRRL
jgi:hypothetical protein